MKDDDQGKPVHETACTESHAGNVILHLSDLHFIKHTDEAIVARNQNTQKDLLKQLNDLPPDWKPNILCITGDISDKNKKEGYEQAQVFVENLILKLKIPPENIIICPGNHDFDTKKAGRYFAKKNIKEENNSFEIPISKIYQNIFANYIEFCQNLKMPEYDYGDHSSYLFGLRLINKMNFIICNSSWYFSGETPKRSIFQKLTNLLFGNEQATQKDENENWLCLRLLEYIESHHDLLEKKQRHENIHIGLLHYPENKLPEEEAFGYSQAQNPPAAVYLAERIDLMLTGHMHSLPLGRGSFVSVPSINCGSTLKESSDDKAFYVIRLSDLAIDYIPFKFDSNSPVNKWVKGKEDSFLTSKGQYKATKLFKNHSIYQFTTHNEIDELKASLEKAEYHIKRLDYTKAYSIVDDAKEGVRRIELTTRGNKLSDIYMRISSIEFNRAVFLCAGKDVPPDYSTAKEYLKKARDAYEK